MLFLLPTALLSFASQPGPNDCSVIQDTCDGCTETGPGDGFISFLNLEQFHSTSATIKPQEPETGPRAAYLSCSLAVLYRLEKLRSQTQLYQVHEWWL